MAKHRYISYDLTQAVCKILSVGNSVIDTCKYTRLPERTFYNWVERGEEALAKQEAGGVLTPDEELYLDFKEQTDRARAGAVVALEAKIFKAADKDWRAAAWLMEHIRPKEWGKTNRLEIEQTTESQITVNLIYDEAANTGRAGAAPHLISNIVEGHARELAAPTGASPTTALTDDDDTGDTTDSDY